MTTLGELRNTLATTLGGDEYVTPQLWGYALAAAYQREPGILLSLDIIPHDSWHPFMSRSQELGNTQTPIFRAEVERLFPQALGSLRRSVEGLLKNKRENLSYSGLKSSNWDWEEFHVFDLIQREIWATTGVSVLEEQSTRVALITDVNGVKALFHYAEEARISCLTEKAAYLKAFTSDKTASELVTHAIVVTRNEAAEKAWNDLRRLLEETLIRTYSK